MREYGQLQWNKWEPFSEYNFSNSDDEEICFLSKEQCESSKIIPLLCRVAMIREFHFNCSTATDHRIWWLHILFEPRDGM